MNLSQNDWTTKLSSALDAIILDVRTQDECNDGIIPDAILNDIYKGQEFISALDKLDKSKKYFVYCKGGGRSAQACNIMSQLGFENVYNLEGGFMNWKGAVEIP
ncbi:MAG: rhodanese-like domain-containing protein [Flavobacterium sp.]|nr:rhodanese-like domain-containing protein [Flavobacterium sp.]